MVFETWLENCLRTTLKAGQVLVMDNATFDKGGPISQLIEDAGCQLLYLPPYSPDLNKIEQCWSWLKSRIRKQPDQFDCLLHATLECLRLCVPRRRKRLLYFEPLDVTAKSSSPKSMAMALPSSLAVGDHRPSSINKEANNDHQAF